MGITVSYKPETLDKYMETVPLGMVTAIFDNEKPFSIDANGEIVEFEYEGQCIKCKDGVATYVGATQDTQYSLEMSGVDMNPEVWATLPEKYKFLWRQAYKAGFIYPSITNDANGEWIAQPLDGSPVEISGPYIIDEETGEEIPVSDDIEEQ